MNSTRTPIKSSYMRGLGRGWNEIHGADPIAVMAVLIRNSKNQKVVTLPPPRRLMHNEVTESKGQGIVLTGSIQRGFGWFKYM